MNKQKCPRCGTEMEWRERSSVNFINIGTFECWKCKKIIAGHQLPNQEPVITEDERLMIPKEDLKNCEKLELEDFNFRIDSTGWEKISNSGFNYLENETRDVWESVDGDCAGEQYFTWDAAMRETKKVGKIIPTDADFSLLIKTKEDMKNVVFACYRDIYGSFYRPTNAYFWSSSQSSADAWFLDLDLSNATVHMTTGSKAYGLSVRCLK